MVKKFKLRLEFDLKNYYEEEIIYLYFPHQLFKNHPGLKLSNDGVSLIEDDLFFGDLNCSTNFSQTKIMVASRIYEEIRSLSENENG